jgi:hypothetical protein
VLAIPGTAADADTCFSPLPSNSWNTSTSVTPAMPHGRLRYDIHARFAAYRRASARVGSRGPGVDSVLIAGHAATADAGTARPGGLPVADAAGVVDKLGGAAGCPLKGASGSGPGESGLPGDRCS